MQGTVVLKTQRRTERTASSGYVVNLLWLNKYQTLDAEETLNFKSRNINWFQWWLSSKIFSTLNKKKLYLHAFMHFEKSKYSNTQIVVTEYLIVKDFS